ncbi:hypothetical protein PPIS_a2341 [Pseudoalteromonas piscicida]|uniref:Uncharacterized protein n=1 Tax=Pseudoalteromonas piscicida TaxID=43662 RepID=A0ABN5CCT9_PSEO7|nr:hypothetical protein PPIS_a2341 [Pseudoalteromonas piscicida]
MLLPYFHCYTQVIQYPKKTEKQPPNRNKKDFFKQFDTKKHQSDNKTYYRLISPTELVL